VLVEQRRIAETPMRAGLAAPDEPIGSQAPQQVLDRGQPHDVRPEQTAAKHPP
jgi:hypothetical protein